jgi:hypothetical protein
MEFTFRNRMMGEETTNVKYDPNEAPPPSTWLAASEEARLEAVLQSHERGGARPKAARLHAAFHVMAETQIAEGLAPTVRAMARLLEGGLERHEALHAIGAVAAEQVYGTLKNGAFDAKAYEVSLDALSAESFRRSSEE